MGNLNLKYAATYDKSDMTRYQVLSDEPSHILSWTLPLPLYMIQVYDSLGGLSRYVNGQEQHFGFQLKGNYAYTLSARQKGHISFGAEYGHFKLDDMRYQMGYNFVETFAGDVQTRGIGKGRENSANVYLQLKHQWDFSLFSYPSSLLLNAGMRFDYKNHYDDTQVRELSPRVALILLRPKWNVRLSYSKSFVDVPYLYRKSNALAALIRERKNDESLSPERAHSFQLSFAGRSQRLLQSCLRPHYDRYSHLQEHEPEQNRRTGVDGWLQTAEAHHSLEPDLDAHFQVDYRTHRTLRETDALLFL